MKSLIKSLLFLAGASLAVMLVADFFVSNGVTLVFAQGALAAFASAVFLLTAVSDYSRAQRRFNDVLAPLSPANTQLALRRGHSARSVRPVAPLTAAR